MKQRYMKPISLVATATIQCNLLRESGDHGHWADTKPNQGGLWEDDEEEPTATGLFEVQDNSTGWVRERKSLYD